MARKEIVLRVFISSPSDVQDEVTSIKRIIEELNRTALRVLGVRLEAITWQDDVIPGISVDVQSLINEQIGDEYDIFVGLLWSRFGKSTPRAGSGTEEEFERAYSRHQKNPSSIRVMFYFKTSDVALDAIDPDQLKKLQSFKSRLGERGALYCEFKTQESFEVFVRSHLTKQVQGWGKEWGHESLPTESSVALNRTMAVDMFSEEGALDLIEIMLEHAGKATQSIGRIGRLLQDIGARSEQSTAQLRNVKSSGTPDINKEVKRILSFAAIDLTQFSRNLDEEAKVLSDSLLTALDAFSKVLTYKDCFTSDDINGLGAFEDSLTLLVTRIETTSLINQEIKEGLESWPRMTTDLNRARRTAVHAIGKYDTVLREALRLLEDAEQNYTDLLRPRQ